MVKAKIQNNEQKTPKKRHENKIKQNKNFTHRHDYHHHDQRHDHFHTHPLSAQKSYALTHTNKCINVIRSSFIRDVFYRL